MLTKEDITYRNGAEEGDLIMCFRRFGWSLCWFQIIGTRKIDLFRKSAIFNLIWKEKIISLNDN